MLDLRAQQQERVGKSKRKFRAQHQDPGGAYRQEGVGPFQESKRKSRAQHQELAGMFQEKAKSIAARVCWRYKSVASRAFSQFQGQAKRLASRVRMFQEKVNSSAMLSIKSALGLIAWPLRRVGKPKSQLREQHQERVGSSKRKRSSQREQHAGLYKEAAKNIGPRVLKLQEKESQEASSKSVLESSRRRSRAWQ